MSETDTVAEPGGGVIYARKTKVQPILIQGPGLSSLAGGVISKAPTSGEEATIVDPIQLLPPAQENGETAESASTLFATTELAADGDKDKVKINPLLKPELGDNFTRPVNEDEDKPPQLSPSLAESPRPRIPRQLLQFKCPECQKTYPNRNTLQVHMGTHRQTTNELFGCGYCDKTFRWKQSLKNHEKTHKEGFQPYTCNKCDKIFTVRASWYTHIRAVSCSTRNRKQSIGQKSPDTPSVESKAKRQSAPAKIEQSGVLIKKRGRPAKIRSASLTNETGSMKKSKVVSNPDLNKSNNPDIPAKKSERIPSNSSIVLEPTFASPFSGRAQRKRNAPKWTESMVMDYGVGFGNNRKRKAVETAPSMILVKPEELAVPIVEKVASPLPHLPVIDPSPNSTSTENLEVEPSNGPSPQSQDTSIHAATFSGMPKLLNQISPTVESDKSSDSEESMNDANASSKDEAIRFLANKISSRTVLRVRQELMQLKQSGNYFKLTKTAPLAAGLMYEIFCQTSRNIVKPDQSK